MPGRPLTIEQILTLLAMTPQRIAAFTADLTPAQLRSAPETNEWSANEVLAHLRACADVWGNCIMAIVTEDRPTVRAVSPRTWIRETDYLELEFRPSLRAFATQRSQLLSVMQVMAPEDWSRTATVTGTGKLLERTALFYAERLARHERAHVKQVERTTNAVRN